VTRLGQLSPFGRYVSLGTGRNVVMVKNRPICALIMPKFWQLFVKIFTFCQKLFRRQKGITSMASFPAILGQYWAISRKHWAIFCSRTCGRTARVCARSRSPARTCVDRS
jgi:hypothetical protein